MSFDRNKQADLTALKAEVTNDPLNIGYSYFTDGNTDKLVGQINAKNYTVSKPRISSSDVRAAITFAAYNNLAIDEQEWIKWVAPGSTDEDIAVTADLKNQLLTSTSFWAAGDRVAMQAAMNAIINVPGSRAEVLFGYGTYISREDWLKAEIEG